MILYYQFNLDLPMVDSTPVKTQNRTRVISMNVKPLLPRKEVLDYIKCFARSYRPVMVEIGNI